jgi:hypothetical protein
MPPMGMAAGGIVRMRNGGLTGMPGENALAGMQAELEAKAKVLAATTGRSFNEILETLVREAQMNMPDYSMVGRTGTGEISDMIAGARSAMGDTYDSVIREAQMNMPDYSMVGRTGMGELPSMPSGTRPPKAVSSGIDLGALRDIDSAVGSGIQDMYGMVPKSSSKPGTESADPLSGILELAQEAQTDASDPRRRRSPSVDTDALISGMVSERVGERPRIGDVTASDIYGGAGFDLGMPTREQGMAADRAKVESIRSNLSPSISSSDIDAGVAGVVSERAPRSGGFGGIADFFGDAFDFGLSERYAERYPDAVKANEQTKSRIADFFDKTPQMERFERNKQIRLNPGMMDYETSLESRLASYQDELTQGLPGLGGYTSDDSYGVRSEDGKKAGGKDVQGGSEVQAQSLSEIVVDRDKKDLSGILSKITSDGASDSAFDRYTSLDFSDLIEDSKRMARANALMQLGAGIASGDTAKALSAAGTAATKGMQDARTLDMRKRLADYQAGREDLRRGEEAERFERQMTLKERKADISESQFDRTLTQAGLKLKADIDKGIRVNKGQLLSYIADVLKESGRDLLPPAGQTRQDMLIELQDQLLRQFGPFLDVDVSELVASGAGGGGGGQPDFSGFSIRN